MLKILVILEDGGKTATVLTNGAQSVDIALTDGVGGYRTKSLPLSLQAEPTIDLWDRFFARRVRFSQTVFCTVTIPDSVDLTAHDINDYLDANDTWPNPLDGAWEPIDNIQDLGPAIEAVVNLTTTEEVPPHD